MPSRLILLSLLLLQEAPVRPPTVTIQPTEGKCQVTFPGNPRPERQAVQTSKGWLMLNRYVVELEGNRNVYTLGWHDIPKSVLIDTKPEKILDRLRDGLLAAHPGRLLSEEPKKKGFFPGRECRLASNSGLHIRARFYLIRERVYQLLIVGTSSEADSPMAQQFFNSFIPKP